MIFKIMLNTVNAIDFINNYYHQIKKTLFYKTIYVPTTEEKLKYFNILFDFCKKNGYTDRKGNIIFEHYCGHSDRVNKFSLKNFLKELDETKKTEKASKTA